MRERTRVGAGIDNRNPLQIGLRFCTISLSCERFRFAAIYLECFKTNCETTRQILHPLSPPHPTSKPTCRSIPPADRTGSVTPCLNVNVISLCFPPFGTTNSTWTAWILWECMDIFISFPLFPPRCDFYQYYSE